MRNTARFLKALADETRVQILCLLFHHPELCVCEIMSAIDITQSKASRHLATLRHAGLVTDRREGAWSFYALRPQDESFQSEMLEVLRRHLAEVPGTAEVLARVQLACQEGGKCHGK
jgi:ArsR family transcriptional regulator